jgi:tryptophan synthase alpha chain
MKKTLNIYFTAGYPGLEETGKIILLLQKHGADMIEIGIPFSDSLMDGPVIQKANETALENGMTLEKLFSQLKEIKDEVRIPLLLMGSMNPIYQYGFEKFCRQCAETGIKGSIIPEMTLTEYRKNYEELYAQHGLSSIFMITPQTGDTRIRSIDENSAAFIYMISSNSTTGNNKNGAPDETYFKRIQQMKLRNPVLTGFNINNGKDFQTACQYTQGAIVGTAFIKTISEGVEEEKIREFMGQFKR